MKIIYIDDEDILHVVNPTGEVPIADVMVKDIPQAYWESMYLVEDEEVPADRTFRDAWKLDFIVKDGKLSPVICEDLDKAKAIHKARLRNERQPLLEAQDVLFMKALESGVNTGDIVAEKQRLRDITKLVDDCTTIEELKQVRI